MLLVKHLCTTIIIEQLFKSCTYKIHLISNLMEKLRVFNYVGVIKDFFIIKIFLLLMNKHEFE